MPRFSREGQDALLSPFARDFSLEELPVAAYACDADGLLSACNRLAVQLWGRTPALNDPRDRFCGSFRLYRTTGEELQRSECPMASALRGEQASSEELVVERPDGTRRVVRCQATPCYDEHGRLSGAVGVLQDVTDQAMRDQRQRDDIASLREADRQKNEFLAMLAHEVRTPLAAIGNGIDLLAMLDDHDFNEPIEIMRNQLKQAVRLIDDLLDVTLVAQGRTQLRKEKVELATVIRTCVATVGPLIHQRQQRLSVTLPSEPIWLDADPARLIQIIQNLLDNASKYTDADGEVALAACREGDRAMLRVSDNGIGIEPEALPQVFGMFKQEVRTGERQRGGLGIGLTLVQRLVELHGGVVHAHSGGSGQGSTFVVQFPLSEPPSTVDQATQLLTTAGRSRAWPQDGLN
jgi:PAS domain S-box-containing protein